MSAFDDNITPYQKLNELTEMVNLHSVQLDAVQQMFTEIQSDRGMWGTIARHALGKWLAQHGQFRNLPIRPIDLPPVVPDTLEVDHATRSDLAPTRKRHPRRFPPVDSEDDSA